MREFSRHYFDAAHAPGRVRPRRIVLSALDCAMEKIRYLAEPAHAEAWINGGPIPIFPARAYLSDERGGIYTPDENRQLDSNADVGLLPPLLRAEVGRAKYFIATNNTYNGARLPDVTARSGYLEALVLCMSNDIDADAAGRMGKSVCVRILNVERLKGILDDQVGAESRMGRCRYTDEERQIDHFAKSLHDKWQNEFRFVWPGLDKEVCVELPPSIAERVELEIMPWTLIGNRLWRRHVQDQVFDGARIELDGNFYSRCTFSASCVLVFGATDVVGLSGCTIRTNRWEYVGAARHMCDHLADIYRSGDGGRAVVDQWFSRWVQRGGVLPPP